MTYLRSLLFAALALLLFSPAVAHSQVAVYGGFSGAFISHGSTDWAYGPVVGIYKQTGYAANVIAIGGDIRGTFLSRNGFNYYTGAAGPRFAFKAPILPFRPYVEGLIGVASFNNGNGTSSSTHFNYQVAGGLDTTIVPHLDWRMLEFNYSAVSGDSINAKTLTTGLVIRFW
jgi:hypothetical protein